MKVVEHPSDPVFVAGTQRRVELRIGDPEPRKSRFTFLSPTDARLVAYALLAELGRATSHT